MLHESGRETTHSFGNRSAGVVMTEPEMLSMLHYQYYESGADIVTAATYQASIEGFMKVSRRIESPVLCGQIGFHAPACASTERI